MKPDFGPLEFLAKTGVETPGSPYILCNEKNQKETLNLLSNVKSSTQFLANVQTDPEKTLETNANSKSEENENKKEEEEIKKSKPNVHIGFSVWFNLDLISVTQPDCAIILDYDIKVYSIYTAIETAFKTSNNPDEFVTNFSQLLWDMKHILVESEAVFQMEMIKEELKKEYGFLSSKESYHAVKKMIEEGRVFFGSADITNPNHMGPIYEWCIKNEVNIETLYLSNIPEWIMEYKSKNPQILFQENALKLISPTTMVIDAFFPTNERKGSGPPQRLTVGQLPNFVKMSARSIQHFKPADHKKDDHDRDKDREDDDPSKKRKSSEDKTNSVITPKNISRKLF